MNIMNRLFLLICAGLTMFAMTGNVLGQEEGTDGDEKLSLSVDVASGFVWRGLILNTSPVVQPSLTFTAGRFSIGTWASTPFVSYEYQELDIFANFQITPFLSIGITDYFNNSWGALSYFKYDKEDTGHAFDFQLMYDGSGSLPLKAMVSTIFAGDDLNDKGKNNFSTYLELGYGNTCKKVDWEVAIGGVPMSSGFYEIDEAKIVNLRLGVSKNFEITPTYSLPLSLNFTVNPTAKAAFLTASVTLF